MNDMQLGEAMRSLPRATASAGFTSRVTRAARCAERPHPTWRLVAAMAMALCIGFTLHAVVMEQQRRAQIELLRAERQKLEAELQAVKAVASEEPVIVFENDQGTRVVMDLDSAIQPASLRTFD